MCGSPVACTSPKFDLSLYLRERPLLTAVLISIGVILYIGFRLHGMERVSPAKTSPASKPSPVVIAPVIPPTQSQPSSDTPVSGQDPQQDTENPQVTPQITEYLAQLEKVDGYRRWMRTELMQASETLKNAYISQSGDDARVRAEVEKPLSDGYIDYGHRYAQLTAYFKSLKPPSGCDRVGKTYEDALAKSSTSMIQSYYCLTQFDLQMSQSVLEASQPEVTKSLEAADHELANMCQNYGITKKLRIRP